MTTEERAHVLVTGRLLRAAAHLRWLVYGLTLIAAWRFSFAAAAAIILGVLALVYGFRVAFDAALFDDIAAERLTTAELDAALGALTKVKENRGWLDRCRGARRLAARLAALAAAQLVAVVLMRWA